MSGAMVKTVLDDFLGYLAAPRLIVPQGLRGEGLRGGGLLGRGGAGNGWSCWAAMTGLYLAGLLLLGAGLAVWQHALHLPGPDAFRAFPDKALVPLVILAAPLGEEAFFRGWLTGRPRALWLFGTALAASLLLGLVMRHIHEQIASLAFLGALVVGGAGWFVLRRRIAVPAWFAGGFPVWFYLSAVGFGLVHLSNYPTLSWALVPMILPQLWAGLVFGYLRMRLGLPASMLAHMTGNAAALAAALLGGL